MPLMLWVYNNSNDTIWDMTTISQYEDLELAKLREWHDVCSDGHGAAYRYPSLHDADAERHQDLNFARGTRSEVSGAQVNPRLPTA